MRARRLGSKPPLLTAVHVLIGIGKEEHQTADGNAAEDNGHQRPPGPGWKGARGRAGGVVAQRTQCLLSDPLQFTGVLRITAVGHFDGAGQCLIDKTAEFATRSVLENIK